jgi:hypothetical protein
MSRSYIGQLDKIICVIEYFTLTISIYIYMTVYEDKRILKLRYTIIVFVLYEFVYQTHPF